MRDEKYFFFLIVFIFYFGFYFSGRKWNELRLYSVSDNVQFQSGFPREHTIIRFDF